MYGEPKITLREILFSTLIIASMYGLGVWLSNPILHSAMEEAQKVISAVKVKDSSKFNHIKRTNVGFFLAEGELIANDTITLPELPGKYSRVDKIKEEYRSHVETYTTTDEKGHTTTHTRIVWSWDRVDEDDFITKSYTFLGERFTGKEIGYGAGAMMDTVIYNKKLWGSDVRFVYYMTPVTVDGVMTGISDDKKFSDTNFRRGKTIEQLVERAEKREHRAPIWFWVTWWILTAAVVFLFYYCENDWLEDKKKYGNF